MLTDLMTGAPPSPPSPCVGSHINIAAARQALQICVAYASMASRYKADRRYGPIGQGRFRRRMRANGRGGQEHTIKWGAHGVLLLFLWVEHEILPLLTSKIYNQY